MNNSQQLTKKDKSLVFPKTFLDAIRSRETGASLEEILKGFNMYFVSYTGNTALSRNQVPMELRKKGLWITYIDFNKKVKTEWYNAEEIDNDSWGDSTNWNDASNTLVGDLSISSDGYWIINGVKSNTKALGPLGEIPLTELNKINEALILASKSEADALKAEQSATKASASANASKTAAESANNNLLAILTALLTATSLEALNARLTLLERQSIKINTSATVPTNNYPSYFNN